MILQEFYVLIWIMGIFNPRDAIKTTIFMEIETITMPYYMQVQ